MKLTKLFETRRVLALIIFVMMMTVVISCSTRTSSQKRNQPRVAQTKKSGPVVYVALGDSTGVGVGAKEGGGYVARLFEMIKSKRAGSRLVNMCVSGATTEDVLREQTETSALSSSTTLVTLGIGINDAGSGWPVERFARNYEEIIRRIKSRTSAPVVVTNLPDLSLAPVAAPQNRAEVRSTIELYNQHLQEIAERHDLLVVDLFSTTQEVIPQHPEFFSGDGFHPSDVGYDYWAKTMWPTVKEAIGE